MNNPKDQAKYTGFDDSKESDSLMISSQCLLEKKINKYGHFIEQIHGKDHVQIQRAL